MSGELGYRPRPAAEIRLTVVYLPRMATLKQDQPIPKAGPSLRPLVGRPTFNVRNVRANNRELGVWLALQDTLRKLLSQRTVHALRYHEALAFDRELSPVVRAIRRLEVLHARYQHRDADHARMIWGQLDGLKEYAWSVGSMSTVAAEALIYSVDHIIKFAGTAARVGGKRDEFLIGGRSVVPGVSLLAAFRVLANWQRHDLEWREGPFREGNFNHDVLQKLGLWRDRDAPVSFLKKLKRPSYFQLESDIVGGLEYLVCEMGMHRPAPAD